MTSLLAQVPFVSPFWAAWVAAAAAAAAVPVIIHLIHTARAPQVPFPTLRFLRSAAQKTARRRKLENLLLMIVRMLLVGVLGLALARPFLAEQFGLFSGEGRGAAVLVLDNSYSMSVQHQSETRFSKAKHQARAVLESRFKPAEAAVLLTNPGLEPVPDRLLVDRARLFRDIDRAQVSTGRADLPAALKAAYALLDKTPNAIKRLWVLTDRQALSWDGLKDLEDVRKHPDIPVAVVRSGEPSFTNVAVTDARVVSQGRVVGLPVRMDVTVRNAAPGPEKRNLLVFVDDFGQARQKESVELGPAGSPGSTKVVALTHVFEKPGPHRVLVTFEGTDSLALDNGRRVAVEIADRIPVLLVKQRQSDIPFQDSNFYLARSLDPFGGSADVAWAIRPTETVLSNLDPASLGRYDAVFLNNVGGLAPDLVRALAAYVAGGRTLVFFLGPEVDAAAYNSLLAAGPGRPAAAPAEPGSDPAMPAALLPGRIKARVGDAVLKTTVEKVATVQGQSPYLKDLVEAADIYQGVLVYEYHRLEGADPDAVLARLSGGDPFLAHKEVGQGHVLVFTTTATTEWTNFPVRNFFLPLMMRIAHLAARSQGGRRDLLAGQPIEVNLWPQVQEKALLEVTGPLGPAGEQVTEQKETALSDGRNLLRFDKTWNLGFYAYRHPQRADVAGLFSTNPDGAESDLAEMADAPLVAALAAKEAHVAATFADLVKRFEASARRELWQYFLLACLALAVLEPLLANWMRPDRRETAHPTIRHQAA